MRTKRTVFMGIAVSVVAMTLAAAGCSQQPSTSEAPTGSAVATTGDLDITLKTNPDPVTTGENAFEAMVMEDGKPVTDVTVATEFFMPAMPSMNMAEMRSKAELAHEGNGVYRGTGQVMMAGNWDVTVRVLRDGREIGSQKMTLTAK